MLDLIISNHDVPKCALQFIDSWGRIIKSVYNIVSHCLPCNSSHNVVNHAVGIMEAFSNVNIVEKLLTKLQEVESSCRCTYNGVGGVIMWTKTML